ncbi:MAG: hypothetical protein ACI82A_003736, partial [Candidatus Azotimanducaceae bacterium]
FFQSFSIRSPPLGLKLESRRLSLDAFLETASI